MTIDKCPVSVSWTGDANVTYDTFEHKPIASANIDDVLGETIYEGDFTNVGKYIATAVLKDTENYVFEGDNTFTVTIDQCPVKVSWTGEANLTYDGNEHKPTASADIEGVLGETIQKDAVAG